jgi:16S rRNA (uracil1498-N3)-methyltransferase
VAIVPVTSERSEIRLDGERADKRIAHWRSVVVSACEQSGRATVPAVAMPGSLAQAMADLPATARRLLLDPQATQGMRKLDLAAGGIVLAIGPEGGWSARDLASLRGNGFEGLRLGPRVLRTETAGIAAIAALQACHGDFA